MATTGPQSAPPQLPPHPDSSPPPLSWEGDKMFNIYIWDYCSKRGFRNTARELMNEADIAPESTPPINARQGLLFEWWSVFWVLFSAKASGSGSEEAMLYTQHQANQAMQRQSNQRMQAPPGQGLPPGQQPQPGMQPPPPGRLPNGIAPRSGMVAFIPNGPMSNGVGPNQGSMQPGGPTAFPMGGGPQPNGIPGPPGGPAQQNFQSMLGGQRSSMSGGMPPQQPPQQPGQQRVPSGPFQSSPNMPTSPPGQQHNPHQPQHSQPPMGQLGGPSPNLQHLSRGGMLPPGQGMNPMNPQQGPPGQPSNAPPPYQRSPSRTASPSQGQGGMMQPSPSLAHRQPPGSGQMLPGGLTDNINQQVLQIPTMALSQIKQDLGIENKDVSTFTAQDKQRILSHFRSKQMQQQNKPMGGGPDGIAAGPSNPMMQQPNQQQRGSQQQRNQQQHQQQQHQQQQQQRGKRSSTSPGEEHENLPRTESSPPERKRQRPSPSEQPASIPNMSFNQQQHPQQPGGPQMMMGPQGGQGVMVMRGMNGGGQPPMGAGMNMGGMGMGGPMGMPHMAGGPMNPQMNHPGNLMQNQMRDQAMRQQQAMLPKGPQQPGMMGNMPGNAGSPPSSDPSSFNIGGQLTGQGGPGFGPRLVQKTMMPPPSPGMNGPPKDQNGSNVLTKNPNNQNPSMPVNHSSPRNPPPNSSNNAGHTPNANGTGPPTPAPGNPQNQNQGPPGPNQGPGLGITGQNMAPSPSSILAVPPPMNTSSMNNQPSLNTDMPGAGIFSTDFIQSVASSLDEFDTGIFRPDGDINFERDFGQWFNPDDATSLDMK